MGPLWVDKHLNYIPLKNTDSVVQLTRYIVTEYGLINIQYDGNSCGCEPRHLMRLGIICFFMWVKHYF